MSPHSTTPAAASPTVPACHRVVVGLGSPFLGDDSIGPRVIRELAGGFGPDIRLVEAHAGGLLLLEELAGMRQAVIVDALLDSRRTPGEVIVAGIDGDSCHAACGHDCSLPQALALGRAMGLRLPDDNDIYLVAIVAEDVSTFTENLSPMVAAALPRACRTVRELIGEVFNTNHTEDKEAA
jgi:hydrogenase maturation protease